MKSNLIIIPTTAILRQNLRLLFTQESERKTSRQTGRDKDREIVYCLVKSMKRKV